MKPSALILMHPGMTGFLGTSCILSGLNRIVGLYLLMSIPFLDRYTKYWVNEGVVLADRDYALIYDKHSNTQTGWQVSATVFWLLYSRMREYATFQTIIHRRNCVRWQVKCYKEVTTKNDVST